MRISTVFFVLKKRFESSRQLAGARGEAERPQCGMQRGESPASKGAPGSRTAGNAGRPLRAEVEEEQSLPAAAKEADIQVEGVYKLVI